MNRTLQQRGLKKSNTQIITEILTKSQDKLSTLLIWKVKH